MSATVPMATMSVKGLQLQRDLDGVAAAGRLDEQRVRELEGDAHAGQVRVRVARQPRRDDDALREVALDLVVVGDHDVHAELAGAGDLGPRVAAAVHGDQQLDPLAGEVLDRARRDAVPLREAVGQVPAHVRAQVPEDVDEQEGGGDAVGVVVAVHRDGLAPRRAPCRCGDARRARPAADRGRGRGGPAP